MASTNDDTVRRRSDGSIDVDFYANRAAELRRAAMDDDTGRLLKRLRDWFEGRFAPGIGLTFPRASEGSWVPTGRASGQTRSR